MHANRALSLRLALTALAAAGLSATMLIADQTEIACSDSETKVIPAQKEFIGLGQTELEAVCEAIEQARNANFSCAGCPRGEVGCNLAGPTFEDEDGNVVDMKSYDPDEDEWEYHREYVQTTDHGSGVWSAGVTLIRGIKISASCTACDAEPKEV